MKNWFTTSHLVSLLLLVTSCKLIEDLTDNNSLGGSTDIPLTAVGSKSDVFVEYEGKVYSNASITIKSKGDGRVTYEGLIDMNQFPDSLKLKGMTTLAQLVDYYKFDTSKTNLTITPDNKLHFEFDLRITSEGYMDYGMEGKPWVIGKYGDGVGTKYEIENSKGQTLTREVTEKTGKDEWPLGFFYIKTSKIEQNTAPDDPAISKIIYRINHRFGLVYIEYQMKDGSTVKLDIWALFV